MEGVALNGERSLDHIQTDVDFANRYRLEYVKHMMSIAAGVFALSVTFMKDLVGETETKASALLPLSWALLIVSLSAGVGHMKAWDRFYIAYRKERVERDRRHRRINPLRVTAEIVQVGGLIAGVVVMMLFAIANLPK